MRTWGMVFGVLICAHAFAQESTTSLQVADVAPAAAASSVMPVNEVKPSPWKLTLASENYSYEADQRNFESAPIISYNWLGVRYAPSKLWELELRQQFQFTTNREHLGARDSRLHYKSTFEIAETVLRAALRPNGLLGSSMALFEVRYYAPTDHVAQANHEMGRLRADAYAEWIINPKFTMAGFFSPRVLFNSADNPNRAVGADAEYYQVRAAPYFMYNINDHWQPYYAYHFVGKSSQAQRGNWDPDMANVGAHEAGLNIYYGAFYINPALLSETNLDDGGGSILTDDSRAFAYENISYNFNVYAVF